MDSPVYSKKSKLIQIFLPIKSSVGERPVVVWGITLHMRRNQAKSMGPSSLIAALLNIWATLSANTLDEGW